MPTRYRNRSRLRDVRTPLLILILVVSLTANFRLLSPSSYASSRDNHPCEGGTCKASLNHVGVRKIIEHIEKEGNNVRDVFLNQIWNCMKKSFTFTYGQLTTSPNISALDRQFSGSHGNGISQNKGRSDPIPSDANGATTTSIVSFLGSDLTNKTRITKFLALPIINPHEYSYIYNQSKACSDPKLRYVIAGPSSPIYFSQRKKVRESKAVEFARDPKNRAKLLFFIGGLSGRSDSDRKTQTRIDEEQKGHGDIVQSSFVDAYRNMTKKAILILRWSSTFCHKSVHVFRMDDDVRVNLPQMTRAAEEVKIAYPNHRFILGDVMTGWTTIRDKKSKYYTTLEEYPYDVLPDFILGGCMGYSVATAELLFEASRRLRPFFLDDVFITGLCAPKVGVNLYNSTAFRMQHFGWLPKI